MIELDVDPLHFDLEPTNAAATIAGAEHATVEATHVDEPASDLSAPLKAKAAGGPMPKPATFAGEGANSIDNDPNPDQE